MKRIILNGIVISYEKIELLKKFCSKQKTKIIESTKILSWIAALSALAAFYTLVERIQNWKGVSFDSILDLVMVIIFVTIFIRSLIQLRREGGSWTKIFWPRK